MLCTPLEKRLNLICSIHIASLHNVALSKAYCFFQLWKMYVDNKEKEGEACKHSVASLVLKSVRISNILI